MSVDSRPRHAASVALGISVAAGLVQVVVIFAATGRRSDSYAGSITLLALAQIVAALTAIVFATLDRRSASGLKTGLHVAGGVVGVCMAPILWFVAMLTGSGGFMMGGAWGRPLRVRGRQVHPELRLGTDWTEGARPDAAALDADTRVALEALWLHDAQKEHASVPAFARLSWLLAAVGAPADLSAWALRAGLEEIDHAQKCFALAAGYGGRSHTVEPMPDLLLSGPGADADDPLVLLAVESLKDGCLLEDFNADVAGACADVCREPVTLAVLRQIAREERSHADFSWALLAWLLERDPKRVAPALRRAATQLADYPRPTAATPDVARLVARADAQAMLDHGRLPDAEWQALWIIRERETRARAGRMLVEAGVG